MLFELAVLATPQLIVRICRCVWHGGTRSPSEWRAHATAHLSPRAGDSHICTLYPMWLVLKLYGAAVAGTTVISFSLLIPCTHRWVRGLRDTAVSALPLDGTIFRSWHGHTRVHRVPITCPGATLVVRRVFQHHIVVMTRVWRNSAGVRLARLRVHSPRGCHSCGGHGIVRGNGALRACAHPWQFILRLFGCLTVHRQSLQHPRPSRGQDRPGS